VTVAALAVQIKAAVMETKYVGLDNCCHRKVNSCYWLTGKENCSIPKSFQSRQSCHVTFGRIHAIQFAWQTTKLIRMRNNLVKLQVHDKIWNVNGRSISIAIRRSHGKSCKIRKLP
jgi:hypothetical protein